MAKMLLVDNLKELRTLIDQQHLLYLESDENPKKIDQRDKLESYIKEYLCLAPHDSKFTFQETADVLHQSASTKSNFSAYKAAVAWKAIGKYADNLISHPWRKEYRNIKLYCGFYKHEIEESLVGAELMFEAMGYRHVGHSSLALPGILDPDRITSVSKDAILAYVECQIMKQIWETLSAQYHVTWLEILEFRENHISTPDQVIRSLTHKFCQRHYQEQVYQRQIQSLENNMPQADYIYRPASIGYYNHTQYPTSYSVPVQARYGPAISSQHVISPSSIYPLTVPYVGSQQQLKPPDIYSVNEHHRHPCYVNPINVPNYTSNGYTLQSDMYSLPSVVPTGQLIEFESTPPYNGNDTYLPRTNTSKYNSSPENLLSHQDILKNEEPCLSSKARNDGAGSWENWDYVYRNLENHGYKKNFEAGNDLFLKGNHQSLSQINSRETDVNSADFTDRMRKINFDKSNESACVLNKGHADNNDEFRSKSTKEKGIKIEGDKFKEQSKIKVDRKLSKSPEKIKKEPANANASDDSAIYAKVNISLKKNNETQSSVKEGLKSKKLRDDFKVLVVNLKDEEDKWQCVTCTYLNSMSKSVCEMCCKSKERGSEINPQPAGGQECPTCTLVNKPGLTKCSACGASLKDSPTYI